MDADTNGDEDDELSPISGVSGCTQYIRRHALEEAMESGLRG